MDPQSKTSARRLLVLFMLVVGVSGVLLAKGTLTFSGAQAKPQRALEDQIPKHLPIEIKIKAEKEKAFKDLVNEKWHRDFELEVENTGGKPIYFLELWVVLPEIISDAGHEVGFPIRYGRGELIRYDTQILPEDVPIRPGESRTFAIPENYRKGWEAHKAREHRTNPTRVQIKFVQMNLGDGTGFDGTDGVPYPYKKKSRSTVH